MTEPPSLKVPKELDAIADLVLAYKTKPKTKPAKKRQRRAAIAAKESSSSIPTEKTPKDNP